MRVAAVAVALSLLLPGTAVAQSPAPSPTAITLEPVTEAAYGIRSVAPVGWTPAGRGIRTRSGSPTDPTLLALQSTPMPVDQLWPSLLSQLGLTVRPEPLVTRSTEAGLDWSLYRVPIESAGVVADLGLAQGGDAAYVILLVSPAKESEALRESVFLPAVEAFAPLPEPSPTPGSDAHTEVDVVFPGGATDVTLAGTLSVPTGVGPHPAVVLMSGSGPQDRDESLSGMTLKPFAILADALASAGVAVLRYDDRGTAKSTGDYGSATIADFTADGAAALAWLRGRDTIDPTRVGILGHSEGGVYIADIAAHDPDVAFVVGLAPVVRPGIDLLLDQNEASVRAQGVSDEEVALSRQFASELYAAALAGDEAAAEQVVRDYFGGVYDRQDAAVQQQLGDRDAFIQAQVDSQLPVLFSPWFLSVLRSDAGADWRRVTAPTLGVFGGKDVQVAADPEGSAMQAALEAAGNTDHSVVTLPDANHLFQSATTGAVTEYATLEQAFTPDLLPLVVDWIVERADVQP